MKTIKIKVCVGTHCAMMGAMNIIELIEDMKEEYQDYHIQVDTVKCFKDCKDASVAPVVEINGEKEYNATSEKVMVKITDVMKE